MSVRRQCELLSVSRSSYYYEPAGESEENLALMRRIDELYLAYPFFGSRRMAAMLSKDGVSINRKRVQRLMRLMRIEAIYAKPKTTQRNPEHRVYPYLLGGLDMKHSDQVWCTDITYIPMRRGFLYLVAIMDWFSRYILAWRLSNSLDVSFCLDALEDALAQGTPGIFNSDQGCQFTSSAFTSRLSEAGVRISMDGRGRCIDNVWIERVWRSLKYEEVYLHDYAAVSDAYDGIGRYLTFYNDLRPHQALAYATPAERYVQGRQRPSPS